MDSTKSPTFEDMRERLGIKPRLLYDLKTVSMVTGVAYNTLRDECAAGRMSYHLPEGRRNGRLVKPEWVDQWIEEGTHAMVCD